MTQQKVLLTQIEASYVLQEAYSLKLRQAKAFGDNHARLGQSIHWTTNPELSSLDMSLQEKLILILDAFHATELDFYHWVDDNSVMEVFYKHYVEQGN